MLVTEHFRLVEFRQPTLYGLPEQQYPTDWIDSRLRPLCLILETIRTEFRDMPITILNGGGYRSIEWNRLHNQEHPGAVIKSQHCEGRAADIRIRFYSASELHTGIMNLHNRGVIRLGGLGLYNTFVHVDIRESSELQRWKG